MMLQLSILTLLLATPAATTDIPAAIPAKAWTTISSADQVLWIAGFIDGNKWARSEVWKACGKALEKPDRFYNRVVGISFAQLQGVMDDIYADPANANIPWRAVLSAAADKIAGDNVEPVLRTYRAIAAQALRDGRDIN